MRTRKAHDLAWCASVERMHRLAGAGAEAKDALRVGGFVRVRGEYVVQPLVARLLEEPLDVPGHRICPLRAMETHQAARTNSGRAHGPGKPVAKHRASGQRLVAASRQKLVGLREPLRALKQSEVSSHITGPPTSSAASLTFSTDTSACEQPPTGQPRAWRLGTFLPSPRARPI